MPPKNYKSNNKAKGGTRIQCRAIDRTGHRCPILANVNSKWCSRHEEDQAKSLKTYKRLSLEFNEHCESACTKAMIHECESMDTLKLWQDNVRHLWSLASRAVEARFRHHKSFYYGGDSGHSTYISYLYSQIRHFEELMGEIDRRGFELLVSPETSKWLLESSTNDNVYCCDEPLVQGTETEEATDRPKTPPLEPSHTNHPKAKSSKSNKKDNAKNSNGNNSGLDDLNFDSASVSSQDSTVAPLSPPPSFIDEPLEALNINDKDDQFLEKHESEVSAYKSTSIVEPIKKSQQDILLEKLVAYLDHGIHIQNEQVRNIRMGMIENLFRFVISRTPSLLVKATPFKGFSPKEFVLQALLTTDELSLLWRRLKFPHSSSDDKDDDCKPNKSLGLITPEIIRNSIVDINRKDAPSTSSSSRLDILNGSVWKKPLETPMSMEEWDHFYDFVGCSGCALSVTRTLPEWITNKRLSFAHSRFPAWSEPNESPSYSIFRALGAAVCSFSQHQTKFERIKPKTRARGLRPVLVERFTRSWVYFRMANLNEYSPGYVEKLISKLEKDFTLIYKKAETKASQNKQKSKSNDKDIIDEDKINDNTLENAEDSLMEKLRTYRSNNNKMTFNEETYWTSRVRTGYTPIERQGAVSTVESFFTPGKILEQFSLEVSQEVKFGRSFNQGWHIIVMDNQIQRSGEEFLTNVAEVMTDIDESSDLLENITTPSISTTHNCTLHPQDQDEMVTQARMFFREREC